MEFQQWFMDKVIDFDKRKKKRHTQKELAQYLSVSQSAISNYLGGIEPPHGENLWNIAIKFGMEVYDILGEEKPNFDIIDNIDFTLSIIENWSNDDLKKLFSKTSKILESRGKETLIVGINDSKVNYSNKKK
jgi:transcriptional regulator with XRE-family HTH domain